MKTFQVMSEEDERLTNNEPSDGYIKRINRFGVISSYTFISFERTMRFNRKCGKIKTVTITKSR